jgi:hypothetical protein
MYLYVGLYTVLRFQLVKFAYEAWKTTYLYVLLVQKKKILPVPLVPEVLRVDKIQAYSVCIVVVLPG